MTSKELSRACKTITGKHIDEYGAVSDMATALNVSYAVISRAKNNGRQNNVLFAYIRFMVKTINEH